MLFNSVEFIVFFIAVSILYFSLPHKSRWVILLAASCIFYLLFNVLFIFVLALGIVVAYYSAMLIEQQHDQRRKKTVFICSVASILIPLAFFKYFNFFNGNFSGVLKLFGSRSPFPFIDILLPVGLSFHTLQVISYLIEVYRGNQKTEHHFGIFSLYVMFYPQVAAGPIERPQNLLEQLNKEHNFSYENFKSGLNLMIWGFVKKILVADRLSIYVDKVYGDCTNYDAFQLAVATVFFSIQLYCDFSGYSDIAIGAARTMGFNLVTNFNRPYFATNIREFWERWHMSLTSWCRDYIYIPLGGNRVSYARQILNIALVFLISGFWHGASWLFIIWGALHAFYFIVYLLLEKYKLLNFNFNYFTRLLCVVFIFILVNFAWIFFRARTMHDAFFICSKLFNGNWSLSTYKTIEDFGPVTTILPIIFTLYIWFVEQRTRPREAGSFKYVSLEIAVAVLNITLILILGSFSGQPFIYFIF